MTVFVNAYIVWLDNHLFRIMIVGNGCNIEYVCDWCMGKYVNIYICLVGPKLFYCASIAGVFVYVCVCVCIRTGDVRFPPSNRNPHSLLYVSCFLSSHYKSSKSIVHNCLTNVYTLYISFQLVKFAFSLFSLYPHYTSFCRTSFEVKFASLT